MNITILHGTIIHTPTKDKFECHEDSYLVVEKNKVKGIYKELPNEYKNIRIHDYKNNLIIPGLCDSHLHAPQFVYRGLGLDLQLMDWLDTYAFPSEAKFKDLDFAKVYYEKFVDELVKNGTTRAVIFGTIHSESCKLLMEILEKRHVCAYVGKVNMDTLSPDYLCESAKESLEDTEKWILDTKDKFEHVKPAITPRFIPTCTSEVLKGLGELAKKYNVPIHSHISEDLGEMNIVRERYPDIATDGEVYDSFSLLTNQTMMAHFIYPTDHEMQLIKDRGVTIAHCPQSHINVRAGVPSLRKMLDLGIKVGLGSDLSGGYSLNIFRAMSETAYLSKVRWLESDREDMYLSIPETFYLGTKGGGQFFGKVGSFEEGYEFDALVIDDSSLGTCLDTLTSEERIERVIHLSDDRHIIGRYVAGEKVF